jgi:hypothetical protein
LDGSGVGNRNPTPREEIGSGTKATRGCHGIGIRYAKFSGYQIKIAQEVITIVVFIWFATMFLKEKIAWNYLVAFAFLGVAAFFAFAFKAPVLAV